MTKKLSDFPSFEGKKLLIALQKRGQELIGSKNVDGLVAIVLGLVNHMVITKRLEDLE